MLWIFSYVSRYFEYLKAQESVYLDRSTLEFTKRVLMAVWIGLILIVDLVVAAVVSQEETVTSILVAVDNHLLSILWAVFVLFGAALVSRVIHRFVAYMRGHLEVKPEKPAAPQTLRFLELFIKYFVYTGAILGAFFGGLALLPASDGVQIGDWITAYIVQPLAQTFDLRTVGFVVVIVVLTFLVSRLVDTILSDYKMRTKKFSPRVIDVFRSTGRIIVYSLGILSIFLIFLFKLLDYTQQIIAGIGLLIVLAISLALSYDSIRNALAGIVLMNADELEEGERVKIGDELVCDVVRMDLTTTQVRNLRGEVVFIPNRELLNTAIMNFSRSKPFAVPVEVKVGFDVPHWRVQEILLKAADKTPGILDDPKPVVFGKDILGNTIIYQLWAYMDNPREMKAIKSELVWNLQELFHSAGVKVLLHDGQEQQ